MELKILKGDIVDAKVDAIVLPANTKLLRLPIPKMGFAP